MADDPRFATCTVQRFYSWLTNTPMDEVPFDAVADLTKNFAVDFNARELAANVVTHASFHQAARSRPIQYARFVEDLTGYQWKGIADKPDCEPRCRGEVDLARNDLLGNHSVMGGSDGWFTLESTLTSSPTSVLAEMWLAEEAAAFVVDHDMDTTASERRLLGTGDLEDVDAQLSVLRDRILGPKAGADLMSLRALYDGVLERGGDMRAAYQLVVTALLLDEQAVMY